MRIYIAGPMTGHVDFNYPRFHKVEDELQLKGFDVVNPAKLFDGKSGLRYTQYIRAGLMELLQCDAIFMLRGYGNSKGASLELEAARLSGLTVILEGEQSDHYFS